MLELAYQLDRLALWFYGSTAVNEDRTVLTCTPRRIVLARVCEGARTETVVAQPAGLVVGLRVALNGIGAATTNHEPSREMQRLSRWLLLDGGGISSIVFVDDAWRVTLGSKLVAGVEPDYLARSNVCARTAMYDVLKAWLKVNKACP